MHFEMAVCKKPTEFASEDFVGTSNGFFWLLDGATPPVGKRNKSLTQFFLNNFTAILHKNSLTYTTTKALLKESLNEMKIIFNDHNIIDTSDYLPYSTIVLFKVTNEIEYAILGDSYLSINYDDNVLTISDDRLKHIAVEERAYVRKLRQDGVNESSDEYTLARKKLIECEMLYQNVKNGYWVAGINPEAAEHAVYGNIPLSNTKIKSILAASDGLARLITHFGQYDDFGKLSYDLISHGASEVFEKLRKLESDQNSFLKPISSKNDDASYILVKLT